MAKEDAEAIQTKILEAKFDFNDMLKQTRMIARMGSMAGMLKLLPGMSKVGPRVKRFPLRARSLLSRGAGPSLSVAY